MTTLVLHIGSPKAGSSAIQASLLGVRWRGAWRGLPPNPYRKTYPSGFIAGLYLKPQALPRFLAQRHHQNPDRFANDLKRYRRIIQRIAQPRWRKPPQALVLSCEYLWRLPQSAVAALRRDFEELGCDRFLIVAYVREPGSLYGSALQQWSRLSTHLQRFDPLVWRYQLRQRLLTWQSVFGESLIVRPFDREQLLGGCVVRDFQNQVVRSLEDLSDWPPLTPVADVNRSATTEELVAMHSIMTRDPQGSVQDARALTHLWDDVTARTAGRGGTPIRVKPEVLQLIRERHQDDLFWLADQYRVRFSVASSDCEHGAQSPDNRSGLAPPIHLMDLIEEPANRELLTDLQDYLRSRC